MTFSIIIPTFNAGNRIKTTIDSIVKQSSRDYEIIIQDGKSTDNTQNIIENFMCQYPFIKYFSEKDKGVYDAMNKAVEKANGEFCIFLGSGDRLHDENVLDKLKQVMNNRKADIYYGYVIETVGEKTIPLIRKINWTYKMKLTPVCHQAVCAKTDLLKNNPFDIMYKIAADQDWLMKMVKRGKKFIYINIPIAFYPMDGLSSNNNDVFVQEQKLIHKTYYPFWQLVRQTWRKIVGKE